MGWVIVQPLIGTHSEIPVASLSVAIAGGVRAGDLVLAAMGEAPLNPQLLVVDDSVGGSNTYNGTGSGAVPGGGAVQTIVWAQAARPTQPLTVTMSNADASFGLMTLTVGTFRRPGTISQDDLKSRNGIGTNMGPMPVVCTGTDDIVIAYVIGYPADTTIGSLHAFDDRHIEDAVLGVGSGCFSNVGVTGTHSLNAFSATSAPWAMLGLALAGHGSGRPSHALSCFSGGTQPAPMYYKQEGGPLLSRSLRRRLRSEGFHV